MLQTLLQVKNIIAQLTVQKKFGVGEEITMDNKGMGVQQIILFQLK